LHTWRAHNRSATVVSIEEAYQGVLQAGHPDTQVASVWVTRAQRHRALTAEVGNHHFNGEIRIAVADEPEQLEEATERPVEE
jgi:hypothetical protein